MGDAGRKHRRLDHFPLSMSLLTEHALDLSAARAEVRELRDFLESNNFFLERQAVAEFRKRPNATVLIGALARGMVVAEAFKYEFRIHGVVAADLVLRSRNKSTVVFVEFEGGNRDSVFAKRSTNQMRHWSREIEHATGQILDWSWTIADSSNSTVLRSNLGADTYDIQFLVVCGRDQSLDSDLLARRFAFRRSRLNVAGCSIVFVTYDGLLAEIAHALTDLRAESEGIPLPP